MFFFVSSWNYDRESLLLVCLADLLSVVLCVCVCVCVFFFGGVVFLVQFLSGSFSFCVCVCVLLLLLLLCFFRRMAGEYNFCDLFCG